MQTPSPDLQTYRRFFPSLSQTIQEYPVVYFDNPGGTQVPSAVLDAMTTYLTRANANTGGAFANSRRTDAIIAEARTTMADFLNADADEIIFGANMTTLTFAISRALGRAFQPGDEILVTTLDHDANIAPWLALRENDVVIQIADIDPATCTLNMDDLHSKLSPRTKLVAIGYASNAVGTINDLATIITWAREVGALVFVDAVQYAPHGPIDVRALDCDFLACSAYKFFGPHLGILYGKRPLLEQLAAYKVRPAPNQPPDKFETGTLNHEGIAGLLGALDYLTMLGRDHTDLYPDEYADWSGRRRALKLAMHAIQEYERGLVAYLLQHLSSIPGLSLLGMTRPEDLPRRVPTVACISNCYIPRDMARELGERGIFTWDGNYYAMALMERLGLGEHGALRIGLAHYNTIEEIDRLLVVLRELHTEVPLSQDA
ncbi:MAG TPA: cysteine desulfurase-like protein [Ktedonobacterales bacterium]|nr:cysteine desulfurase-like protein [Ktedonobacterales bacterium]